LTQAGSKRFKGSLSTAADLSLSAQQIYPATDTDFSINAAGHDVQIGGGNVDAAKPLSALGTLSITAANILQAGVLRAPMGQIHLNASEQLTLAQGSQTSVSAAGMTVGYGEITGSNWTTPAGGTLTSLPAKQITLTADSVSTQAGSVVDLSGGGELQGSEFVAGKGGSTDIFANNSGA
jgi:filamentous hemagglutinin